MTNSLTKCGFWSCRIVVSLFENLRRGWGYMGVHSILTDDLTMRRESAKRTSSILANDSNFLDQRNIPVVHQSPYFLDMAPCDFWLSPHLKTQLKGTQFESRDDIIRNTTAKLYSVRKKVFQECFEQWRNRWENLCSVTWRLLRRGLGVQTSWRVKTFFPAEGRILFERDTCRTLKTFHETMTINILQTSNSHGNRLVIYMEPVLV